MVTAIIMMLVLGAILGLGLGIDQKAAIAEYLNTTPGPDGTCVKVKA